MSEPVQAPHPTSAERNTYDGLAEHYDLLMTNGYYDYGLFSEALHELLASRRRVVELGVGTGLFAEKLLELDDGYRIVGVDNNVSMMEQARRRLGDRIQFVLQDVTRLDLAGTFEAAFSVGGCWYFTNDDGDLELCSHVQDRTDLARGLARVARHVERGGLLAFGLQNVHRGYSKELPDGLCYTQEISPRSGGRFTKRYLITRDGEVVAEQLYDYLLVDPDETHELMRAAGCEPMGLDRAGQFFGYEKRADG